MRFIRTLLGGVAAAALATSAHAVVLYQNNFDGNEAWDAGVSGAFSGLPTEAANAGAWNADGWAGNYGAYRATDNSFASLTLTGLAAHTTISASFLLGFLESWDSRNGGCCSPDELEIWIDGALAASMTADNGLGSIEDYDGGTELYDGAQINTNFGFSDALVDMSTASFLTFAHTGNSVTFELRGTGAGWQGSTDEGFGLDDVVITYDGVHDDVPGIPEPATWAMMILGFGFAGAAMRRRRTLTA